MVYTQVDRLIVAALAMLVHIETFLFDPGADAQATELLDAVEEQETTHGSPQDDDQDTEALHAEEVPAVAVEKTAVGGQQAGHQRPEDTADTVDGGSTHRVVDVKLVVDELDREDQHDV